MLPDGGALSLCVRTRAIGATASSESAPERREAGAHLRSRTPAGVGPFRDGRPPRGMASSSSFRPIRRRRRNQRSGGSDRGPGSGCSSLRHDRSGNRRPALRRRPARSLRSEIRRTTVVVIGGHRETWFPSGTDPAGPVRRRRVDLCLPGGSARCTGQSAVGRGEMRTAEKSVRRQEEHRRRRAGECACRVRKCSGAESAVAVTWGREGDRSRRARGGAEDGVQRLGAVVALCSAVRSERAAGWWPGGSPGAAG